MDMDVIFLGTGGSVPSAKRNTASILVRRGGDRLLFDCGEGTQRQMQRSTGLVQVNDIFVTHLHADHYLGLPGLIKTFDLQDRSEPLAIHGPRGLRDLFTAIGRIIGRVGYTVQPFAVEHRVEANGYVLFEDERPGRFNPERAAELGVEEGPAFGKLQRGEEVDGADGTVGPTDVMSSPRPGRKLVFTGDTVPCEATQIAAHDADLLVHDASFSAAEAERAAETGHSTALQAAELARDAEARMLALVHISARHFIPEILDEARAVFPAAIAPRDFDLVDIPFPERGGPVLVENGARDRPEPAEPPAEGGEPVSA